MASNNDSRSRVSLRSILDVTATFAMLIAAGVVIWTMLLRPAQTAPGPDRRPIPVPAEPVSVAGAPVLGHADARVAMIAFSDFECPFCGRFANDILPEIKAKYIDTGKVKFVFRHLPLTRIHPRAVPAAEAAECAARQGRFWEMHDRLFADPTKLQNADIAAYAEALGLDEAALATCLQGQASARVQEDVALATTLKLTGTPAFLLGVMQADGTVKVAEIMAGARPAAEFAVSLEKILSSV
jgi:protein-disulfide isomerase